MQSLAIGSDYSASCDDAKKELNIPKNRYANINPCT